VALLRLGVNVTVGAPTAYQLSIGQAEDPFAVRGAGVLRLSDAADEAVKNADVIYTDAWVSMGAENETAQRRRDLATFQVNEELLEGAKAHAIVLHCLPAHRGDEITDAVLDGERSRVWRQVFHRRSAMLGVLRWIKGES
jgi:ornithine carbamoyltransferase